MKKILALLGLTSTIALSGCSGKIKVNPDKQKYEVGIAQLVTHPALDAATAGFKEKLTSLLQAAGREVSFIENNAAGDSALCPTITTDLVSKDVDLILANATPCLTAAYAATSYIPILGTSITDYGAALGIEFKDGKSGKNVSGTSDLAPLDQQASEMVKLLPSANKIGIIYCSSEANSKFQVDEISKQLSSLGKTVTPRPFTDSSDLKSVCQKSAAEDDAVYIPTDNTAASNVSIIDGIFAPAHKPVYAGESGICEGAGIATLSIDYHRLGEVTGEMAFNVLLGKNKIDEYAVQYDKDVKKLYNKERCDAYGIVVPEGYEEL